MDNDLQLITTKSFNGVELDCYVEPNQQDKGAFWATRTQIGQLLEYVEPGVAIGKIHQRNQERLDKFSRVHQIDLPSGGVQYVTIYNFKGLLEICRYSNQPKANAVMDWLFDVADEIRRTGSYTRQSDEELKRKDQELNIRKAELLQSMIGMCPMTDETKTVFIHEAYKALTGNSLLSMLPESTEKWYSATDIGQVLGISANKVGRIAKEYGIKAPEGESNEYGTLDILKVKAFQPRMLHVYL
jgi:prophage antirepressor-like protein